MKFKIIINAILLFLAGSSAFAQLKETVKSLEKINEQLYASNSEVSNKQYAFFLEALNTEKDLNTLQVAQVDSVQWKSKESYNEPYVTYYHKHKAYDNYPVVNISYEAAVAYCNWLTKLYEQDKNRKFKKVIFRLPTIIEWEMAAAAGNNNAVYPWKENLTENKNGKVQANYKRGNGDATGSAAYLNDNADITAPVKSYWPNGFGLYNMAGNVSEMTASNTSIKGGSWRDTADLLKIKNTQSYDGTPKPSVGFRCFMEVIEK